MEYILLDWTGTHIWTKEKWDSFEDAEEFLCSYLGEHYDTDRGEYYIEKEGE